jgi:iron complex outermembrane receptor protein
MFNAAGEEEQGSDGGMMSSLNGKAVCIWSLAMASVAVIALQQPATAQERGDALEEIIVTARKTAENVQRVPSSINVISAHTLENKGINNLSDISALAPNLVWSDAGGSTMQNRITLRGIYSNASSQGFDPGVGVYVDDVYVGNTFGFNSALLDVDRIEVLKGPQGTLFGRNTSAGAISMHTKAPSTDAASTTVDLRKGNFDLTELRGLINVPLSQVAAFKVSAIYRDRDGYQRNIRDGERNLNDEHFWGGRAQLLVTPTDKLELLGTVEYFKNKDHQDVLSCSAVSGALPCPNPTRDSVFDDIAGDSGTSTKRQSFGASLRAAWQVGDGFEVTSISAFRSLKIDIDQDQDYTAGDYTRTGQHVPKDRQFSQELRVSTPRDQRLRGVLGGYYYNEDRVTDLTLTLTPAAIASAGGQAVTQNFLQTTHAAMTTTSWAGFAQGQFDILSNLTAELGVRYTRDSKDFSYQQTENALLTAFPSAVRNALFLVPFPLGSTSASFNKVTKTGSLSWRPVDNVMAYFVYSTGFKAGGFQSATNSSAYNPLVPFGPENSRQLEGGVKTEWLDRRVRFNAAVFKIDYDDIQVQITDSVTKQKIVSNFGAAESKGLELESSLLVTQGLTLDGNLGLQRSQFTSGSLVGRVFQYVPRATASLGANYRHDLWDGLSGLFNLSATYRSQINLNTNAPGTATFLASGPMTILNGRIGIAQDDKGWTVSLWGNNLTDVRRFADFRAPSAPTPPSYHITTPRLFGIELKSTF